MSRNSHRVTTDHIAFLAAGPSRAGGVRATTLADTDDGIRLVDPELVLTPGSGVRRVLLGRTALVDGAHAAGMSVSAYVKANGGRLAAELNKLINENGDS